MALAETDHKTFLQAMTEIKNGGRWAMKQTYDCIVVKVGPIEAVTTKDNKAKQNQNIDLSDGTATLRYTTWNPPTKLVEGQGAHITWGMVKMVEKDGKTYYSLAIEKLGEGGSIVPLPQAPCAAVATPKDFWNTSNAGSAPSKPNKAIPNELIIPITRKNYPYTGKDIKKAVDELFTRMWMSLPKETKEILSKDFKKELDVVNWDEEK